MGHGPMQYMRDFKAFACDFEYYLSLSNEPVSVCLTERQMYILSVWNSYTPWMTRWYNTEDTSSAQLALIAAEIEDLLMCGCGVPVPSLTDIYNTTNYVNTTNAVYNETYNTWNDNGQTVVSIAPNLDFDTGDPVNISKLVCFAIEALIRAALAQAQQVNNGTAAQSVNMTNQIAAAMAGLATAGGLATGIGGAAAGVVAFFGGPWMLLGLALGGVGLHIATLFMGADNSLFQNTTAIDNVICNAQANLDNKQITRAAFQAALTPLGYGPGTPEAQLAALIQPYLDDLNVYLQFLSQGNVLYDAVTFADLPDCDCSAWCRHLDAAHGLGTFFVATGGLGPQALWNGSQWGPNNALINSRITLEADMGATYNLTSMRYKFSGTNAVGDLNSVVWLNYPFAGVVDIAPWTANTLLVATVSQQKFNIDIESSFDTSVPITVGLTDVYVYGTGPEPSWGEPC